MEMNQSLQHKDVIFFNIHLKIYMHNELVPVILVDVDEIHVLQKTWQDLADRSQGKGIDKDTFLQYFPLTGLLGGKDGMS